MTSLNHSAERWPSVPLSSIIRINYGEALKTEDRDQSGGWSVFGSSGLVGKHDKSLFKHPSVVIGRKGSVGAITYAPDGGWVIDTAFYTEIIDSQSVDYRYLYYALSQAGLSRHTITTSIPGINRDAIYGCEIPLPPLAEQKRIAAILDKTDAVRRKRRESIRLADDFLRAAFLDIVGPDASGYEAWPTLILEDLAVKGKGSMRTGPFGSDLRHSEFVDDGIAVLGIDNAVNNEFAWAERRFITPAKYEQLKRYTVYPDDVIITIMGTTGRSAVVPNDIPTAITTKHLASITLNRDMAEPEFVALAIHSHPDILQQIDQANRGAIMNGLNLSLIKSLRLRVPPLSVQRRLAKVIERLRCNKCKQIELNADADMLFQSLSHRAFSGEL